MVSHLEEDLRLSTEATSSEKAALENALSHIKLELQRHVQTIDDLETNLSSAGQKITQLGGVLSEKETSLMQLQGKLKEYEKLLKEKDLLSSKLA